MSATNNLLYSVLPCYLNTLSFGFVIGFTSPMLSKMEAEGEPFHNDPDAATWFTSIATIGAMMGSLVGASIVDKLGRRKSILVTCIPYLIGWLFIGMGHNSTVLSYGRFLTGMGIGMTCVVCPMFISEVSTKELRGKLGSGFQLSITIGIILAYSIGMLLEWRTFAILLSLVPIVTMALSLSILESPRYLMDRGLKQEASRSLLQLRDSSSAAETELVDMEAGAVNSAKSITLADVLEPGVIKPLKVSLAIMLLQQFTGVNIVMFYSKSIFQSAGFKADNSAYASCLIGLIQFIFTAIATVLMDKAGRKLLLLAAGAGMGFSCCLMSYCYHQQELSAVANSDVTISYGTTVLFSLICYIAFFSLGWGPVPMVLSSEIFPSKVKGAALGGSIFVSWITAFIVTLYFPALKIILGMSGVFGLFAFSCFLGMLYVHLCVPETMGRSLDEISAFFSLARPWDVDSD